MKLLSFSCFSVPKSKVLLCVRAFSQFSQKKVGILGVPFGRGQKDDGIKQKGLELAPDAIRGTSLIRDLKRLGVDVKDFGNVSYESLDSSVTVSKLINYNHVIPNLQKVSQSVAEILKDGRTCVALGGDHSIFTGTLHGHMTVVGAENVAVVYVDAHADINSNITTDTGNMHGMPVAMVALELQKQWEHLPNLEWLQSKKLPLSRIGYIGLRSVDEPEAQIISKYGIAASNMSDIIKFGIHGVLEMILRRIDPENNKWIHLSIDTDSLDPLEAPSTTVPVRGGLLLRDLIYIAETLSQTNRVRAIDWVELNPLVGTKEEQLRTLDAAREALLACFGNTSCSSAQYVGRN